MRFSNIFILAVAVCAATFANAAPTQGGVEIEARNVQFARDNLDLNHVVQTRNHNEPKSENVVRDLNNDFDTTTVHRRGEEFVKRLGGGGGGGGGGGHGGWSKPLPDRRDVDDLASYTWAEFTDDYGNNGYGHLSLFSTTNFYVPDGKTKIKIHSWPTNSASTFYIENIYTNEKQ